MTEADPAKWEQVSNCLLGVALGDATGAPTEMMSPEEILAATRGDGVTGPGAEIDASKRKVADTRDLEPGATTDDWALTACVGEMYARLGRFDAEILALLHLRAFHWSRSGYGGTTAIALYEMEKYFQSCVQRTLAEIPPRAGATKKERERWELALPRHPAIPAPVHVRSQGKGYGSGNGPAMKIAPVGLFYGLNGWDPENREPVLSEVMRIAFMTHGDPNPGVAAFAIATAIAEMIRRPAKDAERLDEIRRSAVSAAACAEHRFAHLLAGTERFSNRLAWAWGAAGRGDVGAREIAALAGEQTSLAIKTVTAAFGFFFLHSHDPKAAVLAAANAGGDADTIASMAGALCGANATDRDAWGDWTRRLREAPQVERLASELYAAAIRPWGLPGIDAEAIKEELGYK